MTTTNKDNAAWMAYFVFSLPLDGSDPTFTNRQGYLSPIDTPAPIKPDEVRRAVKKLINRTVSEMKVDPNTLGFTFAKWDHKQAKWLPTNSQFLGTGVKL